MSQTNNNDYNKDGIIDESDVKIDKTLAQKRMAWTAIASIVVFTAFLFLPIIPDSRIEILSDISSLFYITLAGIVGAYMGIEAWMSRR